MDLRGKLSRLASAGPGSRGDRAAKGEAPPPAVASESEKAERIARIRGMLDALVSRDRARVPERRATRADVLATLPGELKETPHGLVHVVERWLEPHYAHGRVAIRDVLEARPELIAELALDPALAAVDVRRMLMLDTETTGLSGGAGTLPFLIGLAWFEDESLRVQQLFLRKPGEEAPMLRVLAERIAAASCIVTYNGKAFDWPLLRTRFVMNRVPMPQPPPHLDLLHCARRVFKRRLSSVRLVDMETEVLGMHRERDVDGAEIPGIYLDFLRGDEETQIATVIEHNGNDLVALAALLARVVRRFETLHPDDDPRDHLSYAHVAARAGDEDRAIVFATAAGEGGGDADCTVGAWVLAARIARGRGATDEEEARLLLALEAAPDDETRAGLHAELAKVLEHRRRDLVRALVHAMCSVDVHEDDVASRRVERLVRRLARANARKGRRPRFTIDPAFSEARR